MSDQWRILVVEDEENLNWSIVNSLRKDGYFVQGVMNGAEAIRMLWAEGYDVVISDLKMPGANGFELLQWLRTNRPTTRLIMVTAFGSASTRNQALEGGVVSYLEKPFDLHTLKEELRRLLQQTGFSANLDSFDLLDVIQIITMSRKSIALLVNTGLEERGVLGFQGGELIWAEYGLLRGEEAFFALAAHKNGVVIHQPWNDQIAPNVTQPLSRLIFQALQYRTKYAQLQQHSSEHEVPVQGVRKGSTNYDTGPADVINRTSMMGLEYSPIHRGSTEQDEDDDRPFVYALEGQELEEPAKTSEQPETREWWQQTGRIPRLGSGSQPPDSGAASQIPQINTQGKAELVAGEAESQRNDLPSWLTEQPTIRGIPTLRPSSLSNSSEVPVTRSSSKERQLSEQHTINRAPTINRGGTGKVTEQAVDKQATGPQAVPGMDVPARQPGILGWQPSQSPTINRADAKIESAPPPTINQGATDEQEPTRESLKSQATSRKTLELSSVSTINQEETSGRAVGMKQSDTAKRTLKRNYSTLVSALQTLGYSIPGFIATAVVTLDGHPIAQVAVDDLDISPLYGYWSTVLQGALLSLGHVDWGGYEDTVITSGERRILLRLVGEENEAFHVLVTTRGADTVESLKMMANVAGAIAAALR